MKGSFCLCESHGCKIMKNDSFIIYGDHPVIAGMVHRTTEFEPEILNIIPGYLKKRLSKKTEGSGNTADEETGNAVNDVKRIVIFEDECGRVDIGAMLMYLQLNDSARGIVFVRDDMRPLGDFTDEGECGTFSDRVFRFNVRFGEKFISDLITLAFFDQTAEPDFDAAEAAYLRIVRQLSEAYMNMASERCRKLNKGIRYFTEAISAVADDTDRINSVTKDLYRAIGRGNGVSGSCVERSMRHSLEQIWSQLGGILGKKVLEHSSEYESMRPTNSEFILFSAKYLRKCCPAVFAAGKLIRDMRNEADGALSGDSDD